jgi:hypothetical protein
MDGNNLDEMVFGAFLVGASYDIHGITIGTTLKATPAQSTFGRYIIL